MTTTMKTYIHKHLKNIEREYDVKILLAVESGSRAWGFESANSDWDVRFIYVHKPEWYLKINSQRDVIEHIYDDGVDLAGWELRKALGLFGRSNPSVFEWLNSPQVYYMDKEFEARLRAVEKSFFNPVKNMYHYNHIYNKHNERYLQQTQCELKRFLYYLRGILACKWLERNNTLPPVSFEELVNKTIDDAGIVSKIKTLIELKRGKKECDMDVVDSQVKEFAMYWSDYYNKIVDSYRPDFEKTTFDVLDKILYDMAFNSN